jgi:predicted dehydrogenase
MSKRSLIVGMGIGQLYKSVLTKLGHKVITVDSDISKGADLPTVESAILAHAPFDTVHICTPNFTHAKFAKQLAPYTKMMFIEKPGVSTSTVWCNMILENPYTRFIMVKNNMWRDNIAELQALAKKAKTVNIEWIRKNCVPNPGSWFTTRELAFGGVSRDLMPHLLSIYIALNPSWRNEQVNGKTTLQQWQLSDIDSTDYGIINSNGVYDVDDKCVINVGSKWTLEANWRSMDNESSAIKFTMQDNSVETFELGWCPEEAYHNMIVDAINNIDNSEFWNKQLEQDLWIHQQVETV